MRPHYAAQLSGTWANHLPFLLINQVAAVLPWHISCTVVCRLTGYLPRYLPTYLLDVPTYRDICVVNLGPDRDMLFWSSAAQVACYSPNSTAVTLSGSGPSWSLPPGPGSGCNASCTCRANLPWCTLLLLSQLNPSSLPGPQPDFRISLSPSLSVCLLSLCVQSLPPFRPAVVHTRTCTTSTRFPPIGTCSDLTATPKQNSGQTPSKPIYLVQTSWSQDRRSRTACLPSHPGPSSSFFLFVSWKRAPRVSLPLHRVYFFSTVTPEITKLSLTRTYSAVALPRVPRALSLIPAAETCNPQPSPSTIRRPNSACCSHNRLDITTTIGALLD